MNQKNIPFIWQLTVALCCLLLATPLLPAQTPALPAPLWLRSPALSPDGRTVAFTYRGDLLTVPVTGGVATPLVSGPGSALSPVWSPDGKTIAFASDRFGNLDIFALPATGGPVARLTFHSANETPFCFSPDGSEIQFGAVRLDSSASATFPYRRMAELYAVPLAGGRPRQILTTPALATSFAPDGKSVFYEDWKGYEDTFRKHQRSPVAHDLWCYDLATRAHTRLTDFDGENRNPVPTADGAALLFLSERSGSFNVWRLNLADPAAPPVQVTFMPPVHPVRSLSVARDGVICFTYGGELYTLPSVSSATPASNPVKIPVVINQSSREPSRRLEKFTEDATEIAVSPDGSELVLAVRGDLFAVSAEYGTTRRLTATPGQERSPQFSPDGRRVLYAAEREGRWTLREICLLRNDESRFANSTATEEKLLLANDHDNFQPVPSPDGKLVAYLEDRTTLKILDPATSQSRVVLDGKWNYSYNDGDQSFQWSPDGQYLLLHFLDSHRWFTEVGLVKSDGSQASSGPLNLTNNGFEDSYPRWILHGQTVAWFTDREGLATTGPSDRSQSDLYATFLTQESFDRFNLSKEDFELLRKQEKKERKAQGKPAEKTEKKTENKKDSPEKTEEKEDEEEEEEDESDSSSRPPVAYDFTHLEERTRRLTPNSADLADAVLTPDGSKLLYLARFEGGHDLWLHNFREDETKRLTKFPSSPDSGPFSDEPRPVLRLDRPGQHAFILTNGKITRYDLREEKSDPVHFDAEMSWSPAEERAALFEHMWRQMREKFYLAGDHLHEADWNLLRSEYLRFLPHIANSRDFAEMMSELLGETNASHTGCRYNPKPPDADATASLGFFPDDTWTGPGLKISEILPSGPLDLAKLQLRPGMVIEKINSVPILPGAEWDSLLNRQAGKPVLLSAFDPATGRRWEESAVPIAQTALADLLYIRWTRQRRDAVDRLSGGRLGYVHVRGMEDNSFRQVFGEVLGRQSGKEALIVDTRFNGGGNLTNELCDFLSGKTYFENVPRGRVIGQEPWRRWTRPSCVLMSEGNYSDAHCFPVAYRALKIGPLVGMPVAGTGTSVWWETQIDPELVFGIPEVGLRTPDGKYLENTTLVPDLQIPNTPEALARGQDEQLEAAVNLLLKK